MTTQQVFILSIIAMMCFVIPICTVQSQSVSDKLIINNQAQLADYIKVLLGKNHGKMTQEMKDFVEDNQISIMNAASQVILVLNQAKSEENKQDTTNYDITAKFIKLLGQSASSVKLHSMVGKSDEQAQTQIDQNLKSDSKQKVHNIFGKQADLQKLSKMFTMHQKRFLEQTTVTSPAADDISFSYITKFFFGLLFIIVCLALFFSIACMETRKDTLLYAKFIADVGR